MINVSKKTVIFLVAMAAVIAAIAALASFSMVTVPTGHTGVVVTFGRVEDYVLDEGVHLKLPWQTVIKMDNRAQKEQLAFQAFSSDIQQVDVSCAVNFSVDRETSQNLYRNVGVSYYETVMQPRIYESIKAVFANYSAENLIGKRSVLSEEVMAILSPEMKVYGIEIINVSIENIDFSDVFTDAVESKQVAEQSKLQAQIEQEQKTMEQNAEAERKLIQIEAEAEAAKIKADAEAYAVRVQAEAEAEANQKLAASISELFNDYKQIEKWNGELPQIVSGDGTVLPIIDRKSVV